MAHTSVLQVTLDQDGDAVDVHDDGDGDDPSVSSVFSAAGKYC